MLASHIPGQQVSPSVSGVRSRRILRWDLDPEPDEGGMEFRLTYAGRLLAYRTDKKERERALHIHEIRRHFHQQLQRLWRVHPVLLKRSEADAESAYGPMVYDREGFHWLPLVTKGNGTVCQLDILLLRDNEPGRVLADIDNRLKTIFDALRLADSPNELGAGTAGGRVTPGNDEDPFYVLLQDDRLITHVAVTTDSLLEPVPGVPVENAARLVIDVTIRPYDVVMGNLSLT